MGTRRKRFAEENVFMIRHSRTISWHGNLFKSLYRSRENWSSVTFQIVSYLRGDIINLWISYLYCSHIYLVVSNFLKIMKINCILLNVWEIFILFWYAKCNFFFVEFIWISGRHHLWSYIFLTYIYVLTVNLCAWNTLVLWWKYLFS